MSELCKIIKEEYEELINYVKHLSKIRSFSLYQATPKTILLCWEIKNSDYLVTINELTGNNPFFAEFHKELTNQGYEIIDEEQAVIIYYNKEAGPGVNLALSDAGITLIINAEQEIKTGLRELINSISNILENQLISEMELKRDSNTY